MPRDNARAATGPVPAVTWRQALSWRLSRHLLDPVGAGSVEDVVGRLCGVQAQVASSAEMAVRVRQARSRAGEVGESLVAGRLIKTWAMRGTLHLLTPDTGAAFLSLIAAGRPWERPSWVRYFGMTPEVMEALRDAVREALGDGVLTREELIAAITPQPGLEHVGEALRSGWGTVLKPLAWQGDLCFGPSRGTRVTFTRPSVASPRWAGVPDADSAAPIAIGAYFRTYGPTTVGAFASWLAGGYFAKRRLKRWFDLMVGRLAAVDVDGERRYVLAEDLGELTAARPTDAVRLLPGFDQWVLGPGTLDAHVLPRQRRADVSRQSGWIAPLALSSGVVSGTWELVGDEARVSWFREAGKPPTTALGAEAERIGAIVGRELRAAITEV